MKTVTCAFCAGEGMDPFGLLSPLATCQVCSGKGEVTVKEPTIRCAFCNGTGIYPNSRLTCTVCMGRGVVTVHGSTHCPDCGGSGRDPYTLPCLSCKGKGVIEIKKGRRSTQINNLRASASEEGR